MGSTPSKVERVLPKGERWYWSEAWQKKVRNAHRDLAAGGVKRYRSVDALRRDLALQ